MNPKIFAVSVLFLFIILLYLSPQSTSSDPPPQPHPLPGEETGPLKILLKLLNTFNPYLL